jgi:hypothetical protein
MEKILLDIISNLLCLAPMCLGLVVFGAVVFLIIRTISRQSKPLTGEQVKADENSLEAKVQPLLARLRPWTSDALAGLSTDWDAKWSRWGRDLNAQGTISTLSDPKGMPLVAFALRVRGALEPDGTLHVRTSQNAFDYRISSGGVTIRVNKSPFGRIQPDGQLLDAQGGVIGEAKRPGGMPAIFRVGGVAILGDKREREYPLILEGRVIGRLSNPLIQIFNAVNLKKTAFAPAAVPAENISEEEALWLTALAILQVAGYNLLEAVWTN